MTHLHFQDSDEEMGDGGTSGPGPGSAAAADPPPAAMAAAAPPGTQPVCCGSARVDFNFSDPCYVFKVLAEPASGVVAASVSNNTIKIYQPSGPKLSLVVELRGHTGTVSDIALCSTSQPALLLSCSADGTAVAWDQRTGQPAERCAYHACATRDAISNVMHRLCLQMLQRQDRPSLHIAGIKHAASSCSRCRPTSTLLQLARLARSCCGTEELASSTASWTIRMPRT
jgi:hypothetical protein